MRMSHLFAILLIFTLIGFTGCSRQETAEPIPFPQKSTSSAYFYTSDDEVNIGVVRLVEKLDDTCTPVKETITYPDGSQRSIHFRADGSIWRIFEFDSPNADGGKPILRRETVYENDGLRPRLHSRFSKSGKRIEKGFREIDNRYHIQYFRDDLTLEKMVVFNSEHKAEEQHFYRTDETQYQKIRVWKKPQRLGVYTAVTKFNNRGVPILRETTSDGGWSDKVTESFFPGTEKVEWKVEDTGYSMNITQFRRNGKKARRWEIKREMMRVEVYSLSSGSNSRLYSQLWNRVDRDITENDKELHFELDAVNEEDFQVYDETGQRKWLRRLVEFEVGGTRPTHIDYVDSPYSKDRTEYLNENGKIERIERIEDDPGTLFEVKKVDEKVDPPRPLDKPLDYSRFKFVPFELPEFFELDFRLNVRPDQVQK